MIGGNKILKGGGGNENATVERLIKIREAIANTNILKKEGEGFKASEDIKKINKSYFEKVEKYFIERWATKIQAVSRGTIGRRAAEKAAREKAAREKAAREKAAQEKAAREKAASDLSILELAKIKVNESDQSDVITQQNQGFIKDIFLSTENLMKQPFPLIMFDNIYNNNEYENTIFITYTDLEDLYKQIFENISNIDASFIQDIEKYSIVISDGKKKILIHILIKLLYERYVMCGVSTCKSFPLKESFKKQVIQYKNLLITEINKALSGSGEKNIMLTAITKFNKTNDENSKINLGIKIRKSAKDSVEWSKSTDINPRVQISRDEDGNYYNTSLKIVWDDTPEKITLNTYEDGSFRNTKSDDGKMDKYYFQGANNIWGNDVNSEKIANDIIPPNDDTNIMVIMGVGQSGSGKTYTLFGPNEGEVNNDTEGVVLKLLKKYKPNSVNVSIGEIYETSSDNYINYNNGNTNEDIKFRFISTNEILNSIKKSNNGENDETPATFNIVENNENTLWTLRNTKNPIELSKYLLEALNIRTIYPTPNNAESSRSHVIMCITFNSKTLFIIDAAGVENEFKCSSSEFNERYKKKLKSAMAMSAKGEPKYMYGMYPNMRQAFVNYSENANLNLKELNKKFSEASRNAAKNPKNNDVTILAKKNNIECNIPDENLKVKVYDYVEQDRKKLQTKISKLFSHIFRYEYDEDWVFTPVPATPAERSKTTKKAITTETINYEEKEVKFNKLNFNKDGKEDQIVAKEWLYSKIKNSDKNNSTLQAIAVLYPFLEPSKIGISQSAGMTKSSNGKTYVHPPSFYVTKRTYTHGILNEKKLALRFRISAFKLFIKFLNEDLNGDLNININRTTQKEEVTIEKELSRSILGITNDSDYLPLTEGQSGNKKTLGGDPYYRKLSKSEPLIENVERLFWGAQPLLSITPELTTDEYCNSNAEKYIEETCNKALVKQGNMINKTLAEFSSDLGKTESSTLFPKYLPSQLFDKDFSKIKEFEYNRLNDWRMGNQPPLMYEDYIPKYFLLSKNNSAGNFGEIIKRMYQLYNNSSPPETTIQTFFNMLKIYIILVINITPIDFGGVQPNNPPTPPYINLELLRRGTNDFHNGGDYKDFEKILAISLEHIYKYEIYQENSDLMRLLDFLTKERETLKLKNPEYVNSAIGQINNII